MSRGTASGQADVEQAADGARVRAERPAVAAERVGQRGRAAMAGRRRAA